jgi:predicted ATPase/DNA-binding winged helix-turn-helix (wHTH) protein
VIEPTAKTRDVVSFGPFSLDPGGRMLMKDGAPVILGARTLDVLIALLSRPNESISKRDLMAAAWPDVVVEEGSLRFQIAILRKALGDGRDGARYISTLAGRGYCFVAPISRLRDQGSERAAAAASFTYANLPSRLTRMVGRDNDVARLSDRLIAARFVSIVGSGGVGKTTVAVAIGHHLMETFAGAVLFVDLGMLSDPMLVATAAASMLGLSVRSDDATPNLIAYLRDKRILLILDTCEHLIEPVASLASQIFSAAPGVHILVTSREALQVDDEHVYRLEPLACPPEDADLTVASVHAFPATQLFLERAVASGARLDLSDADAAIVGAICRKLDGVALAIELAARRVESYGLQRTAALLDQRLTLLWSGPRMATPRQKTLQATLDWSFGLLTDVERHVLCRLAVFVGHFTLDAALDVVSDAALDQSVVLGAMDSLVAKSMVATRPIGAMMRYRLLDTTRAYARETEVTGTDSRELGARHATYYRRWLEQNGAEWSVLKTGAQRAPHFAGLNNVRAGLEWCFGANGNTEVGVRLAAAAAPVFLAMSLLPECHRWSERAIFALDDESLGRSDEMQLQAALGVSLMLMRGSGEAVRVALTRSLEIAVQRGDALTQLKLFGPLRMFHSRLGDFKTALDYARQGAAVSRSISDPAALALAHSMLGMSLYLTGDLSGGRMELEAALLQGPGSQQVATTHLGFDGYNMAGATLAKILWLQGYPAQAAERARQTVKDAARLDHPVTLSVSLVWAIFVLLETGDLPSAEEHVDRFIANAESHSLGPYLAVGRGFKGQLAVRRSDAGYGVKDLRDCLEQLHAIRYELLTTPFDIALAQGLAAMGRFVEGMTLVDESIRRVEINGDLCYLPELLRVKGALLLSSPPGGGDDAEMCLMRSLELSRRQGARSWELRAATDLAVLLNARGRSGDARALLQPVFDQFTEGRETADLKAAQWLLATLG